MIKDLENKVVLNRYEYELTEFILVNRYHHLFNRAEWLIQDYKHRIDMGDE